MSLHTFPLCFISKLKRNATDSSFFSRLPLYGTGVDCKSHTLANEGIETRSKEAGIGRVSSLNSTRPRVSNAE